MIYPEGFFHLQLQFAKKVSIILKIPLPETLFSYTSLPIRFGISFSQLTSDNPIWQKFLGRMKTNSNLLEVIYTYHVERMKNAPPIRPQFGCFSYDALEDEKGIRLHFDNNDTPEPGALSEKRVDQRKNELHNMFYEVKLKHPDFTFVISSSWLYNIAAFKRLFPPSFTDNATVIKNYYPSLGLWGQFINKYGQVKEEVQKQFLTNLQKSRTFEEVENSFPLKELKAEANIIDFYRFYNVE